MNAMNRIHKFKQVQARLTSKGMRVWLEGNDLINTGFTHGSTYTVELGIDCVTLYLDVNGKRKVAGNTARPVIDLQSKKLSAIFNEGMVDINMSAIGVITIDQEV